MQDHMPTVQDSDTARMARWRKNKLLKLGWIPFIKY